MIKRTTFIAAIMVALLSGGWVKGGVSVIVNGSFEDDGLIADITVEEPNNWDVNVPTDQFAGQVYDYWPTDGSYNLTLYSYWYVAFEVNDIATVSQWVYLSDVNEIVFDLKLDAYDGNGWDPNKRTALVLIDDVEVWNSDNWEPDVNGEYRNQPVNVDIEDTGLHKLSLGIKADVNEYFINVDTLYYTHWDFIRFNLHCGGFGFLPGDFNRDCYVDMNDLEMLADVWLDEVVPNSKYNLYQSDDTDPYGVINFRDFAIFANSWDGNMPDLKMFTEVWLNEVDPNNEYNLFRDDDVGPRGIVNFLDFAVLADNWLKSSYD